ncbi:MAG: DegT/DnrJ/EryC1/StrS family aminotransferase [Sphingobacteriales bacterium]|jgi:UDP-2-acetamido-2-deoxy-ribo-hexuluronate aminotransferase
MTPIQMVDLKTQYHHIKDQVDKAVLDVMGSTAFINGKPVQDFTQSLSGYLGAKHVIPCANGTDALQIAMMALDLQPGDEVITPSFTYIATTEVVALLKLKPVFAEVDPDTFCIDPASIRTLITPRTKAIVPVHLYGQSAPMEEIMKIAEEFGLYVIEDNAQAIGADFHYSNGTQKKTGTIGHIGATSFFPSKNLGCYGDGGAIFTQDDTLADKMRKIANHGQSVRYYHDLVGCNSRLDTLQAAILNIKLPLLDQYTAARQKAAAFYTQAFADESRIKTPIIADYSTHVFHQYTLTLENVNRDALNTYLADQQIPSMIYYPVPAHKQKMFAGLQQTEPSLPVTDWLCQRVISLPMHTELTEEQLNYIVDHIRQFLNKG